MSRTGARVLLVGSTGRTARELRDAGHEVVAVGEDVAPEAVAAVAEQEDVDVVAVCDADAGADVAERVAGSVVVFWVT